MRLEVSRAEARRIAVRAAAPRRSRRASLDTVRTARLPPARPDLDGGAAAAARALEPAADALRCRRSSIGCLWDERTLFEWNALRLAGRGPAARPWPHAPLANVDHYSWERRGERVPAENPRFRRYVLRELEQRGPLLSRELEDRSARATRAAPLVRQPPRRADARPPPPAAARSRSSAARGGQRLWDLAERWYPETEARAATRGRAAARGEALRARSACSLDREGLARAPRGRRRPGPRPGHAALALRPPDPRPRPRRGALGLPVPPRDVRPEGEEVARSGNK